MFSRGCFHKLICKYISLLFISASSGWQKEREKESDRVWIFSFNCVILMRRKLSFSGDHPVTLGVKQAVVTVLSLWDLTADVQKEAGFEWNQHQSHLFLPPWPKKRLLQHSLPPILTGLDHTEQGWVGMSPLQFPCWDFHRGTPLSAPVYCTSAPLMSVLRCTIPWSDPAKVPHRNVTTPAPNIATGHCDRLTLCLL